METIRVALCFLDEEGNVLVKKPLGSDWQVNNLTEYHELLIINEVAEVISEAVKVGLTAEIIKEMLEELKEVK